MAGLIHVYCGDGKGKTTAAMGLALRAAGSGKRVVVLQFSKDGKSSELGPLGQVPGIEVIPQTETFGFFWTLSPEEKTAAAAYYSGLLEKAFAEAENGCGLLVLDEAMSACTNGFISEARLLDLLRQRPEDLEVVLTGRGPSEQMLDAADYVTEMCKRKHPFEKGVPARKGIEF
ncbi:MAG: cob(I)yrinic acid a,c-diamide adenosyltransferase [Oscillospiraceae bacterium]|nr:cob(I)yrinic acid a,c-diamide adenosyltransferase [Oscillospiraceae bacterium]